MKDIKNILNDELRELLKRKNNLAAFIGTEPFYDLSQGQRSLLIVQRDAMETYATCLYERTLNL